jgi:hypothetical protein
MKEKSFGIHATAFRLLDSEDFCTPANIYDCQTETFHPNARG